MEEGKGREQEEELAEGGTDKEVPSPGLGRSYFESRRGGTTKMTGRPGPSFRLYE